MNQTSPISGEVTPRPDPTRLTTQAVQLAIDTLRELFKAELGAVKEVHSVKLDSLKEQLGKADGATTKQFDAMTSVNNSVQRSLDEKINTLKERVVTIEATISGERFAHKERRESGQYIIAIAGIGLGIFIALWGK